MHPIHFRAEKHPISDGLFPNTFEIAVDSIPYHHHINDLDNQSDIELMVINHSRISLDIPMKSLCDLDAKSVVIGTHHKTGTRLWRELGAEINKFYETKCGKKSKKLVIRSPDVDLYWLRNQYQMELSESNQSLHDFHRTVIHSIRDPVDTILSGYNYHKLISTEKRTRRRHYRSSNAFYNVIRRGKPRNHRNSQNPEGTERSDLLASLDPLDAMDFSTAAEWCYNFMFFNDSSQSMGLMPKLASNYSSDPMLVLPKKVQQKYTIHYVLNQKFNLSMGLQYGVLSDLRTCFDSNSISWQLVISGEKHVVYK